MAFLGGTVNSKKEENGRKYIKRNTAVQLTGLNLVATWFFTVHHSYRLLLTLEGKDFKVSSTRSSTSSTYCLLLFAATTRAVANRSATAALSDLQQGEKNLFLNQRNVNNVTATPSSSPIVKV